MLNTSRFASKISDNIAITNVIFTWLGSNVKENQVAEVLFALREISKSE